ncbi:MAG TPA: AAA family ATPase [Terriglobales bacterium]|nr:AAA family ATPase [Terriglobales bacterium]
MKRVVLSFDDCEVDPQRRQLRRNGIPVTLEPRVFDLMLDLIHKRDRVVGHAELVESVWNGRVVTRSAVNACMSRLRRALGDSDGRQRLLRSFPRFGYRFVGEVRLSTAALPHLELIGRELELEQLASCLKEATAGHGRALFVQGAAGIGKTRLLETFATRVRAQSVRVLKGVCDESDDPLLLWPWVQILASWVGVLDAASIRQTLAATGPDLARVIPTLRPHYSAEAPSSAEPAEARVRLLDSVCSTVLQLAARDPVMLVIEDAQWIDADSHLVLRYLLRRFGNVPLLLVMTHRRSLLRRFDGNSAEVQFLDLNGLDPGASHELAEAVIGQLPSPGRLAELLELADGNPLFIRELSRASGHDEDPLVVPDSLGALLETELHDLPSAARQLLSCAAIADGTTFRLDRLCRAAQLSDEEATAAIEASVRQGMIAPVPGSDQDYRFLSSLQRLHLRGAVSHQQRAAIAIALQQSLD